MELGIPCFLNESMYLNGFRTYEEWLPDKAPHIAISGATGTGKTYAVKLLLGKVSKHHHDSMLTVCDFKGDNDFQFLSECKRFYRFEDCIKGFKQFYEEFIAVQRDQNKKSGMHILLFDEWASFINYLDKKEAEEYKKMLSSLLMLGRSFDYHVILSQQRLDAEYFGRARDNFNVIITLGNPSKEVIGMFYSDFKDEIIQDRKRGTGYMLINGAELKKIIVPEIDNMNAVNSAIKQIVDVKEINI